MNEPKPLPEVWERQAAEPADAFHAFSIYRDTPPDLRKIARTSPRTSAVLSKWYRDWNWEERCKTYDANFDKINVEERERIFRQSARTRAIDHACMVSDMKLLWRREFDKLIEASNSSEMHGLISTRDLLKLGELAFKIDRLADGLTTENVGHTDMDLSKLSIDELEKLEELMTKAGMKLSAGDE